MPNKSNKLTLRDDAEKLRATPFETVQDLEAAQYQIRLAVWRRLTEAQVARELLATDAFQELRETLQARWNGRQ